MEAIFMLVMMLIVAMLIGKWASNWGRSAGGWFLLTLLISPILTAIVLLAVGRSKENIT